MFIKNNFNVYIYTSQSLSLYHICFVLYWHFINISRIVPSLAYFLLRLPKCALILNLKFKKRHERSVLLNVFMSSCLKWILRCTYSIPNMFSVRGCCSVTCMLFLSASSVSQSSWCFWISLPCCPCWMGSSWSCRIVLFLFWGVRGCFSCFNQTSSQWHSFPLTPKGHCTATWFIYSQHLDCIKMQKSKRDSAEWVCSSSTQKKTACGTQCLKSR